MTTINQTPRQDAVLHAVVRPKINPRFSSTAQPQTRLFWD
jgi:hypothetical protein